MNSMRSTGAVSLLACLVLVMAPLGIGIAQVRSSAPGAPGAPARVTAVALRDAAIVAWVLPASSDSDPPITSYTITAVDSESPRTVVARVKATAPGITVHGLTSQRCYIFRVYASNAAGDGQESQASEPTCPLSAPEADIALTMTAPESSSNGAELTFTMTITNNGLGDAGMVTVSDTLPLPLSSATASQGACGGVPGVTAFNCNLGALDSGASATVTVTVLMGQSDVTNTASAKGFDAAGAALDDPVPGNNSASATVRRAN